MKRRHKGQGSIYKTGESWTVAISMGYDRQTGKRVRLKLTAPTKREAQAILKEKLREIRPAGKDTTVSEWLHHWYANCRSEKIRENTARSYKSTIGMIIAEMGSLPLARLTGDILQEHLRRMTATHYRKAELITTILKMALSRAVAENVIISNPASTLELPPRPKPREFVPPTKDQYKALTDTATHLYCWSTIIHMETVTGLRRSEILALEWKNLTTNNDGTGSIIIVSTLIVGETINNKRPVIKSGTKSQAGERSLPLPAYIMEMLEEHREKQRKLLGENSPLIFTTNEGKPINPDTFSRMYYRIRKKLGIKATFHQLRHDFASRMHESGLFSPKDIQNQLGHSSVKITLDRYTHIGEEAKQRVSNWLSSKRF